MHSQFYVFLFEVSLFPISSLLTQFCMHVTGNIMSLKELVDLILVLDYIVHGSKNSKLILVVLLSMYRSSDMAVILTT